MIAWFYSFKRRIVGRIKILMMTSWFLTIGAMALPVAFTLITLGAINKNIPIVLYWLGWILGGFAFFAFFIAMFRAHYEDVERREHREEDQKCFWSLMKSIEAMRGELNGLRGDLKKWKQK